MNRRALLKQAGLSTIASTIAGRNSLAQLLPAPSSSIHLNQAGFLPYAVKTVAFVVPDSSSLSPSFTLVSEATGKAVFTGTLSAPRQDVASGDRIAQADFSGWTKPGTYRLAAQGERTEPFLIGPSAYAAPLSLSVRAFYGQRCGCAVDLGGGYTHPACHLDGAFHASSGRKGPLANAGGWHDAGDYGRYVVNSGITTGTLLWAWELYPEALQRLALAIPESGGKLPDFLAEVRWNLQWMLSLQDEDGGVWHKQTSEQFCAFIMPEHDKLTSFVIGTGQSPYKNSAATADFAAVMAIAARCYAPYDKAFMALCLAAAKRAWKWSAANPNVTFKNPPGVATGGYGDEHCGDELLWAAAELWRTTGDTEYHQAFVAQHPADFTIQAPSWGNVASLAYWTYALAQRRQDPALHDRILQQTALAAKTLIDRHAASGYGNTLAVTDYIWGSNAVAANQSLLLLVADRLQSNRSAVDAALGNLDYLLGRNCFGVSWVTHVGTKPFQHPHHRPSAADGIAAPWPGMLSGGPNARPGDKVARTLGNLPPMRMWIDDQEAYSLNEIAINWNAPLVFLLAAANARSL